MNDGPISPQLRRGPDYLPGYLSNGVIGLRVREVPLLNGVAVLNGLAGEHPVTQIECTPHAPYPLGGDLRVGGMRMSDHLSCVRLIEQRYDFSCGELTSRFAFVARDATAEVEVVTLCSRTHPAIVFQRVGVCVDQSCELEISAKLDPRSVPGRWKRRYVELPGDDDPPVDVVTCRHRPSSNTASGGDLDPHVRVDSDGRNVVSPPESNLLAADVPRRRVFVTGEAEQGSQLAAIIIAQIGCTANILQLPIVIEAEHEPVGMPKCSADRAEEVPRRMAERYFIQPRRPPLYECASPLATMPSVPTSRGICVTPLTRLSSIAGSGRQHQRRGNVGKQLLFGWSRRAASRPADSAPALVATVASRRDNPHATFASEWPRSLRSQIGYEQQIASAQC